MDNSLLERAAELRAEAKRLEEEAFETRPLPKQWRKGMRVRFLANKEWAWDKGEEATIVQLSKECYTSRACYYQVFWVQHDTISGIFWTTPDEVELVVPVDTKE